MVYYGKELYSISLYHHGVKGQKWGVRRYQNTDGSLTQSGKERYRRYQNELVSYTNRGREAYQHSDSRYKEFLNQYKRSKAEVKKWKRLRNRDRNAIRFDQAGDKARMVFDDTMKKTGDKTIAAKSAEHAYYGYLTANWVKTNMFGPVGVAVKSVRNRTTKDVEKIKPLSSMNPVKEKKLAKKHSENYNFTHSKGRQNILNLISSIERELEAQEKKRNKQ